MTADDLLRWEIRMGFKTKQEAAWAIGKHREWYGKYQTGEKPIPLTVALACAAVEHGLKPLPRKSRK